MEITAFTNIEYYVSLTARVVMRTSLAEHFWRVSN
jgi:hypothetical protein